MSRTFVQTLFIGLKLVCIYENYRLVYTPRAQKKSKLIGFIALGVSQKTIVCNIELKYVYKIIRF